MFLEIKVTGTNAKDFSQPKVVTINTDSIQFVRRTDDETALVYFTPNFGYETEQTYDLFLDYLKAVEPVFMPERKLQ